MPILDERLGPPVITPGSAEQGPFRDPAFVDNKTLPVHRWVPWIAGYAAPFVDDVVAAYLPPHTTALVLDPFCGVGTTLVQAASHGYETIGFEINPYAALAAQAKLSAPTIDVSALDHVLAHVQTVSRTWKTTAVPAGIIPPPLRSRLPFFSPAIETPGEVLYNRLREHAASIQQGADLELDAFRCRYLVVDDIWIPLGESLLIATFSPLWNYHLWFDMIRGELAPHNMAPHTLGSFRLYYTLTHNDY